MASFTELEIQAIRDMYNEIQSGKALYLGRDHYR